MALRILGLHLVAKEVGILTKTGPCIIIANHQHLLDLFIFGSLFPPRTVTIGKKSLILIPIFGWAYWLAGNLLIDRKNSEKAKMKMQEAERLVIRKKLSIFICPEGTRSHGKGLGPFKKGAFHLAVDSGLPLAPVVVSSYFGKTNFWRWRSGTVIVECLNPMMTKGLGPDAVAIVLEKAHAQMKVAIERLDRELSSDC
ncbi:MAG: 1-acylglycerol-3-phosphate O-acyltransferase [Deltaproteobacteria bacterium]|nr:1-acylglycerol-3-phosphate O-acyltransferase [Deltaproteobacteria bacterium]